MRPSVQIPHTLPTLQKHFSSKATTSQHHPASSFLLAMTDSLWPPLRSVPGDELLQCCTGKNKSSVLKALLRCLGMTMRQVRGRKAEVHQGRWYCRGSEREKPPQEVPLLQLIQNLTLRTDSMWKEPSDRIQKSQ